MPPCAPAAAAMPATASSYICKSCTAVPGNGGIVIGGTSGGSARNAVTTFASSPATITTDKLDYAPGETVTFSGTNFAPGEQVRVVIHEDPHTHLDRNFDSLANGYRTHSGNTPA